MYRFLIGIILLFSCSDNTYHDNEVLISNSRNNLDNIIVDTVYKVQDSSTYYIIDSLKSSVSGNSNAFMVLNSIYAESDGEISEYFMEIMTDLFYNNYSNLSQYLYNNSKTDQLHIALIEGLSMDISISEEPEKDIDLIKSKILYESANLEIKDFMMQLQKKIDPKLFE